MPLISAKTMSSSDEQGLSDSVHRWSAHPESANNTPLNASIIGEPNLQASSTTQTEHVSKGQSNSEGKQKADQDMLRYTGAHAGKGVGRFARALVQSPMELSVSITKGFHNLPKAWGDDTVRPQERVHDLKSGVRAMGREFGFGFYDGITGLVTQPWKGAQKEGASGFFKGVGKGVGGLLTKPGAAMVGILGHSMKGVHKEVQRLYGNNVQSYIIVSRVAQGQTDWLQSTDEEKQNVIDRWRLIQKSLKGKHTSEEMIQDMLKAQGEGLVDGIDREKSFVNSLLNPDQMSQTSARLVHERPRGSLRRAYTSPGGSMDEGISDLDVAVGSGSKAARSTMIEDPREGMTKAPVSVPPRASSTPTSKEGRALLEALALKEAESQQHYAAMSDYEAQLRLAITQSLQDELQNEEGDKIGPPVNSHHAFFEGSDDSRNRSVERVGQQQFQTRDHGHLAGTSRTDFEVQMRTRQGEKTLQELSEEEIVLQYVKKQSLLEIELSKTN